MLKQKFLIDKVHFILIGVILLFIGLKFLYLIFLFVLYLGYLFLNNKKIFFCTFIITLLIFVVFTIKEINYYNNGRCEFIGVIEKIDQKNEYFTLTIKAQTLKYQVSTKDYFEVGDKVLVKGEIVDLSVHYPNGFNYQEYLHYQNIKYQLDNTIIEKVGKNYTIHWPHFLLKQYMNNSFDEHTAKYLKTLIIGCDESLDTTNIAKVGISHLFVISGLHMNIIILLISKLLSIFRLHPKKQNIIIVIFCSLYVIITNFMISIIRVYLSFVFKIINKRYTNLDLLSINALVVLLINPYYAYNMSFLLTYLIAFFMLIYKDVFCFKNKLVNYLVNTFTITFLVQLLTLPIVISINPDVNFISVVVNPFYIIYVTYILLPMSIITLLIPYLSGIYYMLVVIFENSLSFVANINVLSISLGNIHFVFKMLYLVFFYFMLYALYSKKYKYLLLFLIVFIIWYYKGIFNLKDRIYFLDLPVGEATLIVSKNNSLVILIDTGEVTKNNIMTTIIKNLGIKSIDYLIISHSDSDHIGGAYNLVQELKVQNLLLNAYDKNSNTSYLINHVKKTRFLKAGDQVMTKKLHLSVLSPSVDYHDTNDNSLVFILEFMNKKILFTGDISAKVEKEIIKKNNIVVDFYKIAHHGSSTSSCLEFINNIKYDYAVVMSGYYNTFGFPKKEVIERFKNAKILTTKEHNTIIVEIRKNKYKLIYAKKY